MNSDLVFMQDNVSAHIIIFTLQKLKNWAVTMMFWPVYLPDLNLIKTLWCIMKNYLQLHYSEKMFYNKLRAACKKA